MKEETKAAVAEMNAAYDDLSDAEKFEPMTPKRMTVKQVRVCALAFAAMMCAVAESH